MSVSLPTWRRAKIYSVGRRGGGSVVVVENPFPQPLAAGATGFLCTATTVWSFVVLEPGGALMLELSGGEPYEASRHGALEQPRQAQRSATY